MIRPRPLLSHIRAGIFLFLLLLSSNTGFASTRITVTNASGTQLVRAETSTTLHAHDGRILLGGINLYRSGTLDDRWTFTYNATTHTVSRYSQDWFGYSDFGTRQYSPTLCRWLIPDPLGEKYYDVSPYAYCAGNPVVLLDLNGLEVIPKSEVELGIIRNTIPEDARMFVQLNEYGFIDRDLLNRYSCDNYNYQNLLDLVNSEMTIEFSVSDRFDYYDSYGLLHDDGKLSYGGIDHWRNGKLWQNSVSRLGWSAKFIL